MKAKNNSFSNTNDYIGRDLAGYPYNTKYPPNIEKNGAKYGGYKTAQEETFFYDFAVQNYDVRFKYEGVDYYLITREDYCALANSSLKKEYECFSNALDLIENLSINGRRLIDIMNDIEEVEVF